MQLVYRGINYSISPSNSLSQGKSPKFTYRGIHYSRISSTSQAMRREEHCKLTYRGATYYRSFYSNPF
ncbi:MAG: DUF4278 domain-containing protein [Leptolyngbyaceae cyanobacterium CSU_1_3]|nr:DUF4278 domain-containing protein [Leptolyngbyaceae cyanobacterium CSU_1_3]